MIKKIEIKDIASFDYKGIEIDDLKMVNVIYGSNGTGKSTVSKVLAQVDKFPQCHIDWKDGIPLDVLVYNKEFCEKNYSEQMPGVFTLGDAASDILTGPPRHLQYKTKAYGMEIMILPYFRPMECVFQARKSRQCEPDSSLG